MHNFLTKCIKNLIGVGNFEKERSRVIRDQNRDSSRTKFNPLRFSIHEPKGERIVAKNQRHIIARNVSYFKKFHPIVRMKKRMLVMMRVETKQILQKKQLKENDESHKVKDFKCNIFLNMGRWVALLEGEYCSS